MNYRGVFRVTVLRSILNRLMYNDSYEAIDQIITNKNVGARKSQNIRDNIFLLGAISNSIINGHEEPIQVQIMDTDKCFDKLWLEATTNALYEAGLNNELLNLLYIENQSADIARATASVLTSGKKRKQIISPSKNNFAVRGGQLWI